MPKRTQVKDADKIERVDDIERLVKDKRTAKRANKQKAKQRQRHYVKTVLRQWRTQQPHQSLSEDDLEEER